jgi:hypothetical protein
VKEDDRIEGKIKREEEKEGVEGIQDRMLRVGKERVSRELEWVPQGKITPLDTLDPEKSWGDEIRTKVPLCEEKSACEDIVKEEEGGKKKDQTTRHIR